MEINSAVDEAVLEAIMQGVEDMIQQGLEKGITAANGVIVISNDAAPFFGVTLRVLFGAAEVGALRGFPLVVASFLEDHEITLIPRKALIDALEKMAGKQ